MPVTRSETPDAAMIERARFIVGIRLSQVGDHAFDRQRLIEEIAQALAAEAATMLANKTAARAIERIEKAEAELSLVRGELAEAKIVSDALIDSAYLAGAAAGFNLGVNEDNEGLAMLHKSREGYLAPLRARQKERHGACAKSQTDAPVQFEQAPSTLPAAK